MPRSIDLIFISTSVFSFPLKTNVLPAASLHFDDQVFRTYYGSQRKMSARKNEEGKAIPRSFSRSSGFRDQRSWSCDLYSILLAIMHSINCLFRRISKRKSNKGDLDLWLQYFSFLYREERRTIQRTVIYGSGQAMDVSIPGITAVKWLIVAVLVTASA